MEERRRFPRSETNCLIWYVTSNDKKIRVVVAKNISASGVVFLAEELLPRSTNLVLRLRIPLKLDNSSSTEKDIKLKGRVVRVEPTTNIPLYKTAVEFLKPSNKLNYYVVEENA